jgi:hypothetical protein
MDAKIVIEVSGGVVQEVYSDDPSVNVVLIDWDNDETGQPVPYPTVPLDQLRESAK